MYAYFQVVQTSCLLIVSRWSQIKDSNSQTLKFQIDLEIKKNYSIKLVFILTRLVIIKNLLLMSSALSQFSQSPATGWIPHKALGLKSMGYTSSWYKLKFYCIMSAENLTFRFLSLFSYSYIWYQEPKWDGQDCLQTSLIKVICHESDKKY